MSYSIQQSVNFSQTLIEYLPLAAGVGGEPAVSIANTVQNTVCNPPMSWAWNRNEFNILNTVAGKQDYTFNITDFGFLEKVSLSDLTGKTFEVKDVYNTNALAKADTINSASWSRPNSCSVQSISYASNLTLRFLAVPDQIYTVTLTYQKLVMPLTNLTSNWILPDSFLDIYNNLFLAEAFSTADDARAQIYRLRGIAALLGKAEGLNEVQKNWFLAQYLSRTSSQELVAQLKTQQGVQSRGV
ncbi:MAG TPA: hypothetical protein VGG71_16275 [Chitinophagaceae bacterium]|jgi:hypothetical protein